MAEFILKPPIGPHTRPFERRAAGLGLFGGSCAGKLWEAVCSLIRRQPKYLGSIEKVESALSAKCGARAPEENQFCGNGGNPIDRAAVGSLRVKETGAGEEK
jgi:hypothetical protein